MTQSVYQTNFTAGELAPALNGLLDFDGYYKGLKTCRNMIVSKYGGVDNRPGTQFISLVHDSSVFTRIIPFQFNSTVKQTALLELGNYTMRVFVAGALQLIDGDVATVLTTPWPSTELKKLKYTQSADVVTVCHPDYPTQQIERTQASSTSPIIWKVVPFANVNGPFKDINVDQSITVYSSNATGNVTLTASEALFTADMVGLEFYIKQSPDNVTNAWEVAIDVNVNEVVIFGDNYYQAVTAGKTGTIGPTVIVGSCKDGSPGVTWQYLHSGFGVVKITGVSSAGSATATVLSRLPDSVVSSVALAEISNVVTGSSASSLPAQVTTRYPHSFITGDQVIISGVLGAVEANGTSVVTVLDTQNFLLNNVFDTSAYTSGGTASKTTVAVPTYFWAMPAWGGKEGYPGTTSYFQNRQLFGGSEGQPSNLWMSAVSGFNDFIVNNPILDSDAITYKILSNQVNTVKHLMELAYLLIFTSGGIYMVQGGQAGNGVITPSNINISFQGANPSSDIAPLRIHNYALFVQEKGNEIRTLGYSFSENAFVGQDVTTLSNHLFTFWTVQDWCYQEIPYSCIWSVRSDGILLGLTFDPSQKIAGWHRHDTQGEFESVCCITEDNQDVVYCVVNRPGIGRCIERMAPRFFQDQRDAFFVDSGLTYDGRISGSPADTFSGLDHLNGKIVSILADGIVYSGVVENGTVSIPTPATVVHIGLPYTSDFETLSLSNSNSGLRDKKKIITAVSLVLDRSSGFMIGPDEDHLDYAVQRQDENWGVADELFSGLLDRAVTCSWTKQGSVFIRQENPLPLSVLACIPQVETGGF
jgi:hypothetical protein